jgi:hypothetical protein
MLPSATEYDPFFAGYIALVPETDIVAALEEQMRELPRFAARIPKEREGFCYAPQKWTIRQVFGHMADAERVFGYRALCISRGERAPLPGFDENEYMALAPFREIPLSEIVSELVDVRRANLAFLKKLGTAAWVIVGTANQNPATPRALAYIMVGHIRHHMKILHERYGVPLEV